MVEGCDLLDHIMALVIRQSFSFRLGGITLPVEDLLIYKLQGLFGQELEQRRVTRPLLCLRRTELQYQIDSP